MFAWLRLLDPALASPHVHLLDVLDGVRPLSTDKPRAEALDRIVTDLLKAIGGKDAPQPMAPEQVRAFVRDSDLAVTRWLGDLDAPEAREFLAWPEDRPYEGGRAMGLVKVLRRARDAAVVAAGDADAHVGVDRGFFAPDPRTLVVRVRGASPWLPSLLARAPLVPVNEKIVTRKRDWAFSKAENQVCNGRFVAASDVPPPGFRSDPTGDSWAIRVFLFKHAKHHDAARTAADRVTVLVGYGADEVLREYALGRVGWILPSALPLDVERQIRASTAAGWEPDPKAEAQRYFQGAARGAYEVPSGRVKVLRFRAAGPFATRAARVAVASLASRDDLAARAGAVVPPGLTSRFVHARATGRLDLPRVADVVPAHGAPGAPRGATLRLLAGPADAAVAARLAERWQASGDEAVTTLLDPLAPASSVDAGAWDVRLDDVRAAYDDPLAFLDPFTTKHPAGACAWSDPRYDALVAGARDVAGFAAAPTPAVAALPAVAGALASGDLERLRRVLLAEAEAILLEEAIVVPLWVPADTGFVAKGVRGLPTGRVWGRRSVLDVVPFVFAAADAPADGGRAADAGGERR